MQIESDPTPRAIHPRTLCLLTALGGCLLACAVQVRAATFNAKDYGAMGGDKTDNTAAFAKCLDAILAAGGGQMFIPDLASNLNGLEFVFAHHASRFGRVGAQRCTHAIAVTGKHGFSIESHIQCTPPTKQNKPASVRTASVA